MRTNEIEKRRNSERSQIIKELRTPDSDHKYEYDDIVRLAINICGTPTALITVANEYRHRFKFQTGLDLKETDCTSAFCEETIQNNRLTVIDPTSRHGKFPTSDHGKGNYIRFYAGAPLRVNGVPVGVLCVVDYRPRKFSTTQLTSLEALANQVSTLLELRYRNIELQRANKDAEKHKDLLTNSNRELYKITQDLLSSEEEIRSNLEHISQLQKNLEIRERQYRQLVENAGDLIYELDENGKFTFANPMMESLCGYSKDNLTKKSYWELVFDEDRNMVVEFYRNQRQNKTEKSYLQFRMVSAHGNIFWIGQNIHMFFDERSWVYKVSSISRDITEFKHTQRKLEESEKLYRLLSTNSTDIICLFENDENLTGKYVSPSVKQVLGYYPEELVGLGPFDLVFHEDRSDVIEITNQHTLKGIPTTIEYRAVRKDGSKIWIESHSNPIVDSDGKMTGFLMTARDVTRRKEFEASLQEAKHRAEQATLAKSQFLSNMSHEIRTPMNGIIGLTTILLDSQPTPEQFENLKLLQFSAENLLTIINDILDFNKIEANKITIESVEMNFTEIAFNLKQIFAPLAASKGLLFNFHVAESIPNKVMGDPVRITQIITNLLANAVKFTDKGKIDFMIYHGPADANLHAIHVEVRDTGIGIQADKLDSIFEKFSQAESDTTRKYGGTGLGLSITRSFLKLMSSDIDVKSLPGIGSTFSFGLLLEEVIDTDAAYLKGKTTKADSTSDGLHVLLVEDNTVNQFVAAKFLEKWKIATDFAENGIEAVKKVQEKYYDLILMDLQMPDMDGYEATTIIRNLPGKHYKNIPIVALTASAMLGMKDKVISVGMNDFISKPFNPDELHATIVKHATIYTNLQRR
jgi:PAS domain S-box-containing protein